MTLETPILIDHTPAYNRITNEFGNYPILYDIKHRNVNEGEVVIKKNIIEGLIAFYNALERGRMVRVKYFTIDDPAAGITVYTDRQWKILFKPQNGISEQISNLEVVIKNSNPSEYIDLRFGERVYWK